MKQSLFTIVFALVLLTSLRGQSKDSLAKPYLFETAFLNNSKLIDTNIIESFHSIDLGQLKVESGKIIVCDPVHVHKAAPIPYNFPKGSFPVQLAFAYTNSIELDSLHYVSYCRVKFSNEPVTQWVLTPYNTGRKLSPGRTHPQYQYTVMSESGIVLDENGQDNLVKWTFLKWASFFVDTVNNSNVTNSWKLKTFGSHTLAVFSGFDVTTAKVYIGLDANKKICRLLIDTGMFYLSPSSFD